METENKQEIDIEQEKPKPKFTDVVGAKIIVKAIKVIATSEKLVKQVRFMTNEDWEFTWKPKEYTSESEEFKGLEIDVQDSRLLTLKEIPQKVYALNDMITDNGKVTLLMDYTIMETLDNKGKKVKYMYLKGNQFDILYPIDEDNKEIKISK